MGQPAYVKATNGASIFWFQRRYFYLQHMYVHSCIYSICSIIPYKLGLLLYGTQANRIVREANGGVPSRAFLLAYMIFIKKIERNEKLILKLLQMKVDLFI